MSVMSDTLRRSFQLSLVFALLVSSVVHSRSLRLLHRAKKQTADQRIAELQALIALAQLRLSQTPEEHRPVYGHGFVDIHNSGRRRRRSVQPDQAQVLVRRVFARWRRPSDRGVWTEI